MEYQNYEDYMRNVLGYIPMQNNVYSTYDNNLGYGYNMQNQYNMPNMNRNYEDVNSLYPDIYKIVYPIVCKLYNENKNRQITKEMLNELTDKIYLIVEPEEHRNSISQQKMPLKNGDVRNPNIKEMETPIQETRHTNYILRDLINILLLREFLRPNRMPFPGNMPPIYNPNMRPPLYGPMQPRNDFYMY